MGQTTALIKQAEHLSPTTIRIMLPNENEFPCDLAMELHDDLGRSIAIIQSKRDQTFIILTTEVVDFSRNYHIATPAEQHDVTLSREILADDMFVYHGSDLGSTLSDDGSAYFKLFSPSAIKVNLLLFCKENPANLIATLPMTRGERGIFALMVAPKQLEACQHLDGYFYQFEVTAYGRTARALDPYAKSMAAFQGDYLDHGGDMVGKGAIIAPRRYKQVFVGTTDLFAPQSLTDVIIYEIHVRDFTIGAPDVAADLRGTFRGFMQKIPHLVQLGMTHVQLMPIHKQFRVDENNRAFTDKGCKIPNYNWGYDPHNYFTPSGWYASTPVDPYVRLREFGELVAALHQAGIGVILDVVFNHTYTNAILDDVAPGIYYRKDTRCYPVDAPALESRSPMTRKLIIDVLKYYVDTFGIDGFRFDLMEFMDMTTLRSIRSALGSSLILYGESWDFTDLPSGEAPIKGHYNNYPHDLDIGLFNDTTRDAYCGRHLAPGFVQGESQLAPRCRAGLMGGLRHFDNGGHFVAIDTDDYNRFAASPAQAVQYLTIHDGFTLWDKIHLSAGGSPQQRARLVKQALAMLFTSQGRIILQGGDEMGRTKPLAPDDPESLRAHTSALVNPTDEIDGVSYFHENSYRSCDYTNMIRWDRLDTPPFNDICRYTRGLIIMRRAIPALRYAHAHSIQQGLRFLGEHAAEDTATAPIIAYELDNTLEKNGATTAYTRLIVVHNTAADPARIACPTITARGQWQVIADEHHAGIKPLVASQVGIENGFVTVPAHSSAVIAKLSFRQSLRKIRNKIFHTFAANRKTN